MLERDRLKADQMYRLYEREDESDAMYFYCLDGVGGYWYDTRDEMFEQHESTDPKQNRIISAQIPSWF
jgi:hypothetical protein